MITTFTNNTKSVALSLRLCDSFHNCVRFNSLPVPCCSTTFACQLQSTELLWCRCYAKMKWSGSLVTPTDSFQAPVLATFVTNFQIAASLCVAVFQTVWYSLVQITLRKQDKEQDRCHLTSAFSQWHLTPWMDLVDLSTGRDSLLERGTTHSVNLNSYSVR